jgi:hypothetical protein
MSEELSLTLALKHFDNYRSIGTKGETLDAYGGQIRIEEDGSVTYLGPQRMIGACKDTDDIFKALKNLLNSEAKNRPIAILQREGPADEYSHVNFFKNGIEFKERKPYITFKVDSEVLGPFGKGPAGSPNTRQINWVLRGEYPDPNDSGNTILVYSKRYAGEISLTCNTESAENADDLRKWLSHVIETNMWYFTYSGIGKFFFLSRSGDYTEKVNETTIHKRTLRYYFEYERLNWISVYKLRELVIDLQIVNKEE